MEIKRFHIDDVELLDNLVAKIREGVLQINNMSYRTNVKAKMTTYKFFNEGNGKPEFDKIRKMFPEYNITDIWGNIYNKGDCTINHTHGDHSNYCSFVYFLKSKWYYSPLIFTDSGKKIRPKEGRFVIFPSNIYHHVPVHRYDNQRITLSGNVSIVGGDTGMILRGPKGEYFGWVKN